MNRRTLLRGSLGVTTAGAFGGLVASGAEGAPTLRSDAEIYGVPTVDPLISQRADPFITRPIGGVLLANAALSAQQQLHAERVLKKLLAVQDPPARRRVGGAPRVPPTSAVSMTASGPVNAS